MLYELREKETPREFTADDITVVVALRLHEGNPWVLRRLRALNGYYAPAPRVIVVDFGSLFPFDAAVREACAEARFKLVRCEDSGVFSLAAARNAGAAQVTTKLLFFSDVDCLGETGLFGRLAEYATGSEMYRVFDQLAVLPVYHLAKACSDAIEAAPARQDRAHRVRMALQRAVLADQGETIDYVDPQSNFFLLRRDFFDYVGGYNEVFRGHGSEDFEFLLRVAHYNLQFPLPRRPLDDRGSPRGDAPAVERGYSGFRRLLELMTIEAELAGLRIAHLDHPRAHASDPWHLGGDRRRARLLAAARPFLQSRSALLDYDWQPRDKCALVLIKHDQHADFMFALRLAGYRLVRADASSEGIEKARAAIRAGGIDAVAIFNPYMTSHAEFTPVLADARAAGLRLCMVERGALPDSWYYGPELAYRDPEFAALDLDGHVFTPGELTEAQRYLSALRSGHATLEQNGDYSATRARLTNEAANYQRVCLIPLQLPQDVAVTKFAEGYLPYAEFAASLDDVARSHPDTLFFVKQHPLSKQPLSIAASNVRLCGIDDNIHALIDLSDLVVCYNSGVGLLALLHQAVVLTIGNAYYNREDLGYRASDLTSALRFASRATRPDPTRVVRFTAWLLHRKYAFFRGKSLVRDMVARRSHEYRHLLWYRLPEAQLRPGQAGDVGRVHLEARVGAASYGAVRLGIAEDLRTGSHEQYNGGELETARMGGTTTSARAAKLKKLVREPRRFLLDARFGPLKWLGRAFERVSRRSSG